MIAREEQKRIEALRACQILDTPRDDRFDRIVFEAAQICRTPIALVSFIDVDRVWFKAKIGLRFQDVPRADSFCTSVILCSEMLVIEDARRDARYSGLKTVTGPPFLRFYAGTPIRAGLGLTVGALCVVDIRPRVLRASEIRSLTNLACMVEKLL